MADEITIIITPARNGMFLTRLESGEILGTWRTPFFTAARILIRRGMLPGMNLVMKTSDGEERMRMTIGKAIGLTVVENQKDGPRKDKFNAPNIVRIKKEEE